MNVVHVEKSLCIICPLIGILGIIMDINQMSTRNMKRSHINVRNVVKPSVIFNVLKTQMKTQWIGKL